jgi:Prp8 binding protein
MAAEKRPASENSSSSQMVVKKPNLGNSKAVSVVNGSGANGALIQAAPRTSGLQAPVMELTGHSGEVFCAKFDPNGNYIASGSMDRSISEFAINTLGKHDIANIS